MGRPKVNNFKMEFIGKILKDESSEWMPLTSQQYNFMQTPTRLFFMKAKMKGVPIAGYHHFENGIAYMDIRLLSLFKVQYQAGPEMNLSETVTFFNDMCCLAPSTLKPFRTPRFYLLNSHCSPLLPTLIILAGSKLYRP